MRQFLLALLLFGVAALTIGASPIADLLARVEVLEATVVTLETGNQTLAGQVTSLEAENLTLSGQVASLGTLNEELSQQVVSLEAESDKELVMMDGGGAEVGTLSGMFFEGSSEFFFLAVTVSAEGLRPIGLASASSSQWLTWEHSASLVGCAWLFGQSHPIGAARELPRRRLCTTATWRKELCSFCSYYGGTRSADHTVRSTANRHLRLGWWAISECSASGLRGRVSDSLPSRHPWRPGRGVMEPEVGITDPARLWSRDEITARPSPVPATPGVYGWYFGEIPPLVPVEGCVTHRGLTLLDVGISPRRPSRMHSWARIMDASEDDDQNSIGHLPIPTP